MTRSSRDGARPTTPKRSIRDPYGLLPAGTPIAAVISVVGLVLVAVVTLAVSNGNLPFSTSSGNGPNASGDVNTVARTPTPSNVVIVPPDPLADVPGTIVYAKDGNIWLQSGKTATQLTTGGDDAMPSFAPDGQSVYFVRTRPAQGYMPIQGVGTGYSMNVPSIMQIPIAGGKVKRIFDALYDPPGRIKWQGWIRDPVVSPDGRTIAMATDMPDPLHSDVVLKLLKLSNGKVTNPGLSQQEPLGHQNPAWSPDGKRLLYVRNDRDGANGTPRIYSYDPATKKAKSLTAPGYLQPAWSPDGRYVAATRTSAFGTDVAILDAKTGAELLRVTNDGDSWAPTWSPRGDQIAFLHVAGQVVDLRMVTLEGSAPGWTLKDPLDLTTNAGLDGVSRPDWFIPASDLPATPPPATPTPTASPSAQ